ncbi:MAG: S-layer homology domain-containing protein [Clostridia bacterium]|nr:S-layer homology domain-containing protein [Clostridia bacterium]
MASRQVIFNPEEFEPNKAITRADFAEYIVRALGIYREGTTHENRFQDVSATGERTLAILIANEYGIVSGYSDGTFRGDNQIIREEAMVMYLRAMKITKLVGSDENRYQSYTDYSQVSEWAKTNVKNVLSAHIFNGTTATKISPKAT